jgi:hypothetical protein
MGANMSEATLRVLAFLRRNRDEMEEMTFPALVEQGLDATQATAASMTRFLGTLHDAGHDIGTYSRQEWDAVDWQQVRDVFVAYYLAWATGEEGGDR